MLKRYFIPLILLLIALAAAVYFFMGTAEHDRNVREAVPVEKFSLSNGLQVVVMTNDRSPVVTHMLVVKAGAADDPYGKSGVAHYLEHLLFSGTKNFPEGVYDRSIARVGGAQNAYTTRDYTLYYATVPSAQLPMVMTMEADRFANLDISPTLAARELKVITEERMMRVENNPAAQWMEQLDALTFLNHPYHQPVIGWAEDMATFTPADAQAFYGQYYRPANMVLVLAGDVTLREAQRYAQRYYGGIGAGVKYARNWPKEPPVRMKRHGEMRDARVKQPRLMQQYVAPSVIEGGRAPALSLAVFAQYIGGSDSSVLYDALVRQQQLAVNISATYNAESIGPAVFRIGATPAPGVSVEQLDAAIHREMARVLAAPLDAVGIARAKTLLKADAIFAQDGLQSLGMMVASLYAIGLDETYFYEWSDQVAAITDAQVRDVAARVLVPAKAVTGYLLPGDAPLEKPMTAEVPYAP
jgi:zinc protease